MEKKATETFKVYAQCWRDLAPQVNPPPLNKEMVSTFIDILYLPFSYQTINNASSNFFYIIIIKERIENGVKPMQTTSFEYKHS